MGLSAMNFYAVGPKAAKFGLKTQNDGDSPFKVIRGHRFWYQSKAHMRLSM